MASYLHWKDLLSTIDKLGRFLAVQSLSYCEHLLSQLKDCRIEMLLVLKNLLEQKSDHQVSSLVLPLLIV